MYFIFRLWLWVWIVESATPKVWNALLPILVKASNVDLMQVACLTWCFIFQQNVVNYVVFPVHDIDKSKFSNS